MNSQTNEETPLLSRLIETPVKKPSTNFTFVRVVGFILLLVLSVASIRNTLPTPLSDTEARELNDFPGIHCYNEYLSRFTAPHSANQRENGYIKDWIVELAQGFKQEATQNGIHMEIIADDPTDLVSKRNKFSTEEYWLVESRNVIIRLVGRSNNTDEAFMVNAHYDSVSTSNGVTDNGMGTAVAIELLRYFVQHPPKHTVIFLFNNFEEGGLIGADAFVNHPWFPSIKLYVNLEGTGAGGRALLFRSNTLAAVKGLASSGTHLFHASPLGNDLLQAKLLKSDTDYTVFSKHGVPGLDISFYYPRSHYHTQRDDLAHTNPQSLQHMGQMALGSVLSIDSSETMLQEAGAPEPIIYYDILGRVMLVYSFFTCQLINILSLIFVPLALFTWSWFSNSGTETTDVGEKLSSLKRNIALTAQGLIATITALAFMVLFVSFAAWIMLLINPSATYGSIKSVAVYLTVAAFLGLVASQLALVRLSNVSRINLSNIQVGFYGLTSFWWILLAFATYLGSQKIAAIYFAIYFFISSTLATVLLVTTSSPSIETDSETSHPRTKFCFLASVVQVLLPVTLMTEFMLLSMDSMRHTTADGTPESAIYFLVSVPIVLIILHLLPWVHAAGELKKMALWTTAIFIVLFLICIVVSPFNGDISPNRIVFNQEYNATEALSTVALITGSSFGVLQKTLKQVLPKEEYESMECSPYLIYQTRCTYRTALSPVYGRTPEEEAEVIVTPPICFDGVCRVDIATKVQNSLLCQFKFSNQNIKGLSVLVNEHEIKADQNGTMHAITTYSNTQASTVKWNFRFDDDQDAGEVLFTCMYDEWTQGELPAFTKLRDDLPIQNLLTIKGGVGLSQVHYFPSIPLN
ncbi:uncharacterized protein EV154DRAFT_604675 [Mucor mucedo]|uniref:uncharacterized protein n=1 Tax=Mucor mucedo TaxID=29922 RepID=UPI00221E54DE|nr:uncharacterized protein EV154DRAFT_604675 [Mucor mucedo]KAI7888595.1 hypothetical protein EV154DRAFT_604675 [Mucor mucedo]